MKVDAKKPLLRMSAAELDATFDELSMEGNVAMLDYARRGHRQEILIAMAVLKLADGTGRQMMVSFDAEYGDGDGTERIDSFIAECQRTGVLLPGEELRRVVVQQTDFLTLTGARLRPIQERIDRRKAARV